MIKLQLAMLMAMTLVVTGCTKKRNFKDKTLQVSVSAKVKGMDPANAGDLYSSTEISRVYEGLLEYHYLKRPYTLQPSLAAAMPEVSKDQLTYTFKIKKGVLFHDNKCFPNGKGRELKAEDFVFSIMRMADAALNSTGWWLLDGRVAGLNEWRKKYTGKEANYSDAVEGLKALDDYTLQFKLTKPYPQFLYSLAMVYTSAVPKEAVDFYKKDFLNNPVGTGPFVTGTFKQSNRIVYTKNPTFRDVFYPSEGAPGDKEKGLLANAGKKLPLVDKIEVMIQKESQPRWLAFEKGKLDFMGIPKDNFDSVVTPGKGVTDAYKKKGIILEITPGLDVTYIAFNHDDPIFKNKKLRQAMSLAYNPVESNRLFFNSNGIIAQSILPPGIGGFDSAFKNPYTEHNVEKAKKLLAEAGYPEGKGLAPITYETTASTVARQQAEFFAKAMADINIKVNVSTNTWPQLTQKTKKRQAQMFGMAWSADYPDAENFLQLLYGPNASPGPNGSNFNNPEFNKQFEVAKNMQDSPQRTAMYKKLVQMVGVEVPIIFGLHRTEFVVKHSWLKNYKRTAFDNGNAKYWDIDLKLKKLTITSGALR